MISQSKIDEVNQFIQTMILHSTVWDEADTNTRGKAVNNSAWTLNKMLAKYFPTMEDIPTDVLANQVVWILRIDDTFLRAEMGASYIQMSGVMVNIQDKDRSIAPYVLNVLNITPDPKTGGLPRRKVGSYNGRTLGTDESLYRRG